MNYCFGSQIADAVLVSGEKRYQVKEHNQKKQCCELDTEIDYGFLVEKNRIKNERLQISELNSGFDTVYWYQGKELTSLIEDQNGCYVSGENADKIPMTFVSDVNKEGNYRITVSLYARKTVNPAIIFLGRRRLAYIGKMDAGSHLHQTFLTNVCPIIPRGHSHEMEDLTVDVTILGDGLQLQSVQIEPVDCPTIYIAGDSTVTDQSADYPYYPFHSYCGWGQMLSAYTGLQAAVSNHSHSGLTTESFRSEGHYSILLNRIKQGDICLFQFGHNDQKLAHLMADGGYKNRLVEYIQEIRNKGANPVLITPLARNTWKGNDGTYNDLLKDYADICIKLGQQFHVPVLDLHGRSMNLVKKLGREKVKAYYFPSDYTHSNDYGAYLFAGYVYDEMKQFSDLLELKCNYQEVYQWKLPEVFPVIEPPKDLSGIDNPDAERLFENLERPKDWLTRVEALELVISAMHFFPTNVYNDAFDDIVGHEVYAGTVECAYQNGLIPDQMIQNHKFLPEQLITGNEFLAIAANGYQSRKGKNLNDFTAEGIKNTKSITREKAAGFLRILKI